MPKPLLSSTRQNQVVFQQVTTCRISSCSAHRDSSIVRTIVEMASRTALGSSSHRSTTSAASGSTCFSNTKISTKLGGGEFGTTECFDGSAFSTSVSKTSAVTAGMAHIGRWVGLAVRTWVPRSATRDQARNVFQPRSPPRRGRWLSADAAGRHGNRPVLHPACLASIRKCRPVLLVTSSRPRLLKPQAAGGIRTHDVQLGNRPGWLAEMLRKPRVFSSLSRSGDFRKASHYTAFFRVLWGYYPGRRVTTPEPTMPIFCAEGLVG